MLIVKRLNNYGKDRPGSVAALGVFDGLHLGHRAILGKLTAVARRLRHDSVTVTFDPPPQSVLSPGKTPGFLTSPEEKERLLETAGVDVLAVIKFSQEVASLSPEDFVERILVGQLHVSHAVCGSDCGFGRGRSGNLGLLRKLGRRHGFKVTEVKPRRLAGQKISSTAVKEALLRGELGKANRMLGRPYSIPGMVVKGQGLGREMGYPTLNLRPHYPLKLIPASGVYAAAARVGKAALGGMLYIGDRPTVGGRGLSIEFHSLEGRPPRGTGRIEVSLLEYLRPDRRFQGLDELAKAIGRDAVRAGLRLRKTRKTRLI